LNVFASVGRYHPPCGIAQTRPATGELLRNGGSQVSSFGAAPGLPHLGAKAADAGLAFDLTVVVSGARDPADTALGAIRQGPSTRPDQ
jgi:hypothetical protein